MKHDIIPTAIVVERYHSPRPAPVKPTGCCEHIMTFICVCICILFLLILLSLGILFVFDRQVFWDKEIPSTTAPAFFTSSPTNIPTAFPTISPQTRLPSRSPTPFPTITPTPFPTQSPSVAATPFPTISPQTPFPSRSPTPFPMATSSPNTDQVLFPEEVRNEDNYIGLFLLNGMSNEAFEAFQTAADKWSAILNGTVPQSNTFLAGESFCGVTFPQDIFIDHLTIAAEVKPIDGVNGILGSAGPCVYFDLPLFGKMTFDSEDIENLVNQGAIESVILHEMGHVLGIGTFWNIANLLQDPVLNEDRTLNNANNQPKMNGTNAIQQYRLLTGNSNEQFVPVEDGTTNGRDIFSPKTNGGGSIDSHWDEDFFLGELMAYSININGRPPPLSATTIASLADFGYTVDLSLAEAYSVSTARSQALRGGVSEIKMMNDILPFVPIKITVD